MIHQSQTHPVLGITLLKRVFFIYHPLKLYRKKGSIFGVAFFRLHYCLPTGLTWIWILTPGYIFCLAKSVFGTLIQLSLSLIILEILCKKTPPNIRMIGEEKKRLLQHPSGGFFTFIKINVYCLKYFRYICHQILSSISLTLLPYGRTFTGTRIMVLPPCTWQAVNIRRYLG